MDEVIQISKINDFIFCPHSIYLHGVYESFHESVYHDIPQKRGKIAHNSVESGSYSSLKKYLQGISVYSDKYKIVGKIDIYDSEENTLIERKYKVKKIYDGYRYQLYAQYFCMREAGYMVEKLAIHSLSDNKRYCLDVPSKELTSEFEEIVAGLKNYSVENGVNYAAPKKCAQCIYKLLCDKSIC